MSAFGMNDTAFLTGITYAASLIAGVLALPVTWLMLRRYRRSIVKFMSQRGSSAPVGTTLRPVALTPRPHRAVLEDRIRAGLIRNVASWRS